jgi:hypothetical protein
VPDGLAEQQGIGVDHDDAPLGWGL